MEKEGAPEIPLGMRVVTAEKGLARFSLFDEGGKSVTSVPMPNIPLGEEFRVVEVVLPEYVGQYISLGDEDVPAVCVLYEGDFFRAIAGAVDSDSDPL